MKSTAFSQRLTFVKKMLQAITGQELNKNGTQGNTRSHGGKQIERILPENIMIYQEEIFYKTGKCLKIHW